MIPMTQKLTKNEAKEGHSSLSWCHRWSPVGTLISRISSVIATAKTPSENASRRPFVISRARYLPGPCHPAAPSSRALRVDRPAVDGACAVQHRLRHRRVRVDDPLELGIAALERHHVDDLADHVAGDVAHDMSAQDLAVLRVADDLHQAGTVVVDDGGASAAQLELADLDLPSRLLGLLLGHPYARDLRVAEGGTRDQIDVDRLGGRSRGGFHRDHALLLGLVREGRAA